MPNDIKYYLHFGESPGVVNKHFMQDVATVYDREIFLQIGTVLVCFFFSSNMYKSSNLIFSMPSNCSAMVR